MKKDIIFYKLLAKQKAIIPIILITSAGTSLIHKYFDNQFGVNIFWAFMLSGVILLLNQKELIRWRNKPIIQKLKEATLILFSSFLVLLIPATFIVLVGLFFVQIYLVTVLSESGDESTPFVKNKISAVKLSDEERKNFNARQKLSYPVPDPEMELAITQSELKMHEILKVKAELEKRISNKESEIDKMQEDLESSKDYQYTKSLKEIIDKEEKEKDDLTKKRFKLMQEKHSLEKQLSIQKIKLEEQKKKEEELKEERNNLKEGLEEKEEHLLREQKKKDELEIKQKRLSNTLNERYREIKELNKVKNSLESEKSKSRKKIDEITEELKETKQKQEQYEKDLVTVQEDLEKRKQEYQAEKEKIKLDLEALLRKKENIEQLYSATLEKLSNVEDQNQLHRKEKGQLAKDVGYLQQQLNILSKNQQAELEGKQNRINEIDSLIDEKKKRENAFRIKLQNIEEDKETIQYDYELYKETQEKKLKQLQGEIESKDNYEEVLKKELAGYKESYNNLGRIRESLTSKVSDLYEQIDEKDNKISNYEQKIQTLERDNKIIEKKLEENFEDLNKLSLNIEKFKQEKRQKQTELEEKEQQFVNLQKEVASIKEDYKSMDSKIKQRENKIKESEELMDSIDIENMELREKYNAQELKNEEYQKKILSLEGETEELKQEKGSYLAELEDLQHYVQGFMDSHSSSNEISKKKEINYRFEELYPDLSISKYFTNRFKKLDKKEQIAVEKQLLFLNYAEKKVSYRKDRAIPVNRGSAIYEVAYEQLDSKGIGKGRIYVRGLRVIALSTDGKDQKRVIQRMKTGELE